MYKRIAIYSVVAVILAAFCLYMRWQNAEHARLASQAVAKPAAPAVVSPPDHILPDRRAALAIADLERLVRGRASDAVHSSFRDGAWHVTVGAAEIGMWPEVPDFSDLMSVLESRARSIGLTPGEDHPHPEIDQAIASFQPLQALSLADRAWASGERGAQLHLEAAHALAQLATQTTDLVGVGDVIGARALAELAICRASGIPGVARDEALIAYQLGYGAHAWAMSDSLSGNDPVRPFVRHDDAALSQLAARSDASVESRFLLLSRLAARHDDPAYRACAERYFSADSVISLPMLATMLTLGSFQSQEGSAELVLSAIADELRLLEDGAPVAAVEEPGDLGIAIQKFESMMTSMKPGADGEWLDGALLRAHYRAAFYSAMWRLGEFNRVALSSIATTSDLAKQLQNLPDGPAAEFGRWYTDLAAAKLGRAAPLDLKADLTALPSFGSRMRFATLKACGGTLIGRRAGVRPQACLLLGQLDTRPDDRLETIELIQDQVLDLVWAESLLAVTARQANPVDEPVQAWWAFMNGDRSTLHALVEAPGISDLEGLQLAGDIAATSPGDSLSPAAAYRSLMRRFPASAQVVLKYNEYCWQHLHTEAPGRYALRAWLAHHPGDDDGLDPVFITTALARSYQREKRYREALAIVQPMAASQQFGAMSATADLMDLCGRGAEAETLAAFALDRYPDSPTALAGLVVLFWRHQRYDDAATLLRDSHYPLDGGHWYTLVAPDFADCFEHQPEACMKAVDALEQREFTNQETMGTLARELYKRGQQDLAFRIEQRVQDAGQDAASRLLASYIFLAGGRGQSEADGWLSERVAGLTDAACSYVDGFGFAESQPGVLWACAPKSDQEMSFTWLLRAAMSLHGGTGDQQRDEALRAHFAAPSADHYTILGRYLLGLEPDSAALARCVDPRSAGEVYFYIGYRAQAEWRYADAARWYLRCIATGQSGNAEYHWAMIQLIRWGTSLKSLQRLAAEDQAAQNKPYMSMLGLL